MFLTKYCSRFHQLYLQIIWYVCMCFYTAHLESSYHLILWVWICCLFSFSKFSPSLCAPVLPVALSEELNAAALVPMDAFLLQLLPLRAFADVVLQQDLREFNACLFFFWYCGVVIDAFLFSLLMKQSLILYWLAVDQSPSNAGHLELIHNHVLSGLLPHIANRCDVMTTMYCISQTSLHFSKRLIPYHLYI